MGGLKKMTRLTPPVISLAFGGMSIGSNYSSCLCALSYERINDFECIEKQIIGAT